MECGRGNTQAAIFVTQASILMQKPGSLLDRERTVQLVEHRTIAREVVGSNLATHLTLASNNNTEQSSIFVIACKWLQNRSTHDQYVRLRVNVGKKRKTG